MLQRALRPEGKLTPDLRYVWLATIAGTIAVVLAGAFALLIPTEYGYVLVIAGAAAYIVVFGVGMTCLFCLPGGTRSKRT